LFIIILTAIQSFINRKIIPNLTHILLIGVLLILISILIYNGSERLRTILGMDTISSLRVTVKNQKIKSEVLQTNTQAMKQAVEIGNKSWNDKLDAVIKVNNTSNKLSNNLRDMLIKKDLVIRKLQSEIATRTSLKSEIGKRSTIPTVKILSSTTEDIHIVKPKTNTRTVKDRLTQKKISSVQIAAVWTKYCKITQSC